MQAKFKSVFAKDYKTEVKTESNVGWDIVDRATYLDSVKLISSMIRGGHQIKMEYSKLTDKPLTDEETYLSPLEKKRMSISQKKAIIDWKDEKVKNYKKAQQKFKDEMDKKAYEDTIDKEVKKRQQKTQDQPKEPTEPIKTP